MRLTKEDLKRKCRYDRIYPFESTVGELANRIVCKAWPDRDARDLLRFDFEQDLRLAVAMRWLERECSKSERTSRKSKRAGKK